MKMMGATRNPGTSCEDVVMVMEELLVDLSDLVIEEVEVFSQSGGRAMPEFAASSGGVCLDLCSCVVDAGTQ
jgi:hypothetical protein